MTVQLLEDTPAVLSLEKLCEEHGYSYEWVSGQKNTDDQAREEHFMKNGKLRTSYSSRIVIQFWYQFVLNIDTAGLVIIKSSRRAK